MLLNRRLIPTNQRGFSTEGIVVLEFQLIGWVLIALFFGAMVGGHKHTARH
jgi:hypothetical protein